jgi:hypothetical protein
MSDLNRLGNYEGKESQERVTQEIDSSMIKAKANWQAHLFQIDEHPPKQALALAKFLNVFSH